MKWMLVYGKAEGYEKKALEQLNRAVGNYIPGGFSCRESEKVTEEELRENNLILLGTAESNRLFSELGEEIPEKGYRLKVGKSPYEEKNQAILLIGSTALDLLYGAVDFEHQYLVYAKNADTTTPVYYFHRLFEEPMKEYERCSAPAVRDRALWTWGYVIYDYKRYIDHMVRLKLNMLIIWNDFPPVNADDLVEYAHANGIKVIWGFAWGWDTNCLAIDLSDLDGMSDGIVAYYEKNYAGLKGDGIYFQSFTETSEEKSGDVLIAEAVTTLVNETSRKLWERHPGLELQFGLHATSVKTKTEYLKKVHPDITIVWEDCGAFPYHYIPKNLEGFRETQTLTDTIMNLRGEQEKYAVVLKGMCCLDWTRFVHQPGPFVLGEQSGEFVRKRAEEKRAIWKYVQAYWMRNAEAARTIIRQLTNQSGGETMISALVEDGMLEEKIWFPVALYAQMLWDGTTDTPDLLAEVAQWDDVSFA